MWSWPNLRYCSDIDTYDLRNTKNKINQDICPPSRNLDLGPPEFEDRRYTKERKCIGGVQGMIVQDVMQAYKRQIQKDVNVKYNRDIQWLLVQLGAVLYSIQKQQQTARR